MKPSLPLLPLLLVIIVLSGCPDSKMPKVPPQVPEPKAVLTGHFDAAILDVSILGNLRPTV